MARPLRLEFAGALYHVTSRGAGVRSCVVIIVRPAPSATTDAGTGIVRNARAMQLNNGAHVSAPCYCRCLTFIWCLRYLTL